MSYQRTWQGVLSMLSDMSTSRGELPDAAFAEITALGSFDCTRSSASPMTLFRSR